MKNDLHSKLVDISVSLLKSRVPKKCIEYRRQYAGYNSNFLEKFGKGKMMKLERKIGKIWYVCREPKTWCSSYIPDVIGWWMERSVVLECKISSSDFRKDKNKKRKAGIFFYYVAPPGIIDPDMLRTEGLFEVPSDYAERKVFLREIKLIKPCIMLKNYNNYREEISCLFATLRSQGIYF